MADTIENTYEIFEELGSGSGGIVYLAYHRRLNKKVVLKEYKQKFTTRPRLLRREVDVLKNLNHPYIPQVYDYFENAENGRTYIVMDYIDGESLDKFLERGMVFSQAQVIVWAKQILEALCYLHSPIHGEPPRGFVHSDIKPANLMLRPTGDICLIDFNIALAIGEKALVGGSPGYASPEHYGLDYSSLIIQKDENTQSMEDDTSTQSMGSITSEMPTDAITPTSSMDDSDPEEGKWKKRLILPDARSDIYSTGASIYHLLSGYRPAKNALEVIPLSKDYFSPQLVNIISKAMMPNPNFRYQTAQEMLTDLRKIREHDPRMKALVRARRIAVSVLASAFLIGGASAFAGLRQMEREHAAKVVVAQQGEEEARRSEEQARIAEEEARRSEEQARIAEEEARQNEEAEQRAKEALEALRSSESAYQKGNIPSAIEYALLSLGLDSPYLPQAQKALTDALGIYNLSDGLKPHLTVDLPSEALKLSISPNGTHVAVVYAYYVAVLNPENGDFIATLPLRPTAAADILFLSDDILLYAGEDGLCAYDIVNQTTLWQVAPAVSLAVSADKNRIAAVDSDGSQAVIYDAATGAQIKEISFEGHKYIFPGAAGVLADPQNDFLALNGNGDFLAASFEDGGLFLFDLIQDTSFEIFDRSEFLRFDGGFYEHYFAFSCTGPEENAFVVFDTASMEQTGGFISPRNYLGYADERGVLVTENELLAQIDPETGENWERAYTTDMIQKFVWGTNGYILTLLKDGTYMFFDEHANKLSVGKRKEGNEIIGTSGPYVVLCSTKTPTVQILKVETHPEAQIFSYDPSIRHDEARLSADENTVMLFQYKEFYLFSIDGNLIAQVDIPEAEEVYDQQYRRKDGESWLEVTYKNGMMRAYSASDGSVLWEKQGEIPDLSFQENFETSRWRIEAPVHSTPMVYDKQTGEWFKSLEQDSYLTYVTEVGDYLITQYTNMSGEHYALLLDQDCNTLAYLPNLCDVLGEILIFDDDILGNMRQSRLYSAQELEMLAQKK